MTIFADGSLCTLAPFREAHLSTVGAGERAFSRNDAAREPAADAIAQAAFDPRSRLILYASCEELKRNLPESDDQFVEVWAIRQKERESARRQILAQHRPKFGLAGHSTLSVGREQLLARERVPLGGPVLRGRQGIGRTFALGFDQVMHEIEKARVGGDLNRATIRLRCVRHVHVS